MDSGVVPGGRALAVNRTTDEPIRVLHLVGSLLPGGTERQLLAIVKRRDAARFEHVLLCASATETDLAPEFEAAGCPVHIVDRGSFGLWGFIWGLSRLIRRLQPDVVHAWLYAPTFWGRAAAIAAGGLAIVASTRSARPYTRAWERRLDRFLSRWTGVRIANSSRVRKMLTEDVGLPAASVEVIVNGADPQRLRCNVSRDEARSRLGWPLEAPVVLAVGRLVEAKNYEMLLRVAGRLRRDRPGLRVAVAGWGPLQEHLLGGCRAMGLGGCVELLGRREDVTRLMAAADVFVLTSRSEGFPNSLLEAMGFGLPVVSTRVSGAEELVEEGVNGFLVDVDDDEAMAARIGELLDDAALRAQVTEAGRRTVRENYSLETMVRRHEAVYERVAGERRSVEESAGHVEARAP